MHTFPFPPRPTSRTPLADDIRAISLACSCDIFGSSRPGPSEVARRSYALDKLATAVARLEITLNEIVENARQDELLRAQNEAAQ